MEIQTPLSKLQTFRVYWCDCKHIFIKIVQDQVTNLNVGIEHLEFWIMEQYM
jgi:hypothetical protein